MAYANKNIQLDKNELKHMVINMRESGMTYQEISNVLESDYGIKRSRQSICGLYNRHSRLIARRFRDRQMVNDVCNLYSILGNATKVNDHMGEFGYYVGYRVVLSIIESHKEYISSIEDAILSTLMKLLFNSDSELDIDKLSKMISYKGVEISKKRLYLFIIKAFEIDIQSQVKSRLSDMYKVTSDTSTVREVAKRFNVELHLRDVT